MNFLNADVANAVNPYLTDVGVGLVFGLGYYLIKYLYGDNKNIKDKKTSTDSSSISLIQWDNLKTVDDFNHTIKANEEDARLNPFEVLDRLNKKQLTPDVNTYNNLLNACYASGNFESADKLIAEIFDFASPIQPDLSTFNIRLKGISCRLESQSSTEKKDEMVEAMDKLIEEMIKANISPNDISINTMLDILIKAGALTRANWKEHLVSLSI